MDFSEIVLKGFCDANNRKFLDKYFVRECKKAEKEQFFEAEEFFNGCLNVVKIFEGCLQKQVLERKSEILQMLSLAKSNKLGYPECKTPEAIEVERNETIKYCEQELKNVRPDGIGDLTFTVNLGTLTKGRVYYHMEYCEVLYIKESIIKAIEQCKTNIEPLPPQPNTKAKPKVEENLSKQITHCKRVEIAKAISEKYSSYKGKDFKILYEALLELDLFPRKGKRSTFFRCLKNEGYNINNPQMLEDIHFKKGYKSAKGGYVKSEDEKQRDVIIEYLKTIINNK